MSDVLFDEVDLDVEEVDMNEVTAAQAKARQVQLIPSERIEGELKKLPLNAFDHFYPGRMTETDMTTSITQFGILQPVLVIDHGAQGFEVADGRSRILNARAAGLIYIPAIVYPAGWTSVEVLTIAANTRRHDNYVTDVLMIRELVKKGAQIKDICIATGLDKATAEKRMKLTRLIPDLFTLMEQNQLSPTLAMKIAPMSEADQNVLYQIYLKNQRLTASDVEAVRRANATSATKSLDDDMFEDEDDQRGERGLALLRQILELVNTQKATLPANMVEAIRELFV